MLIRLWVALGILRVSRKVSYWILPEARENAND